MVVGGSYIVFAKVGDFPEWLSLLHLVVGVSAFLAAVHTTFSARFARYGGDAHGASGFKATAAGDGVEQE